MNGADSKQDAMFATFFLLDRHAWRFKWFGRHDHVHAFPRVVDFSIRVLGSYQTAYSTILYVYSTSTWSAHPVRDGRVQQWDFTCSRVHNTLCRQTHQSQSGTDDAS